MHGETVKKKKKIHLLCLPLDTSVPVGRICLVVRLREVSELTNTYPAILT